MIVAGFGFRRAATVASLQSALDQATDGLTIDALAAPIDKCETPAFRAFAAALKRPVLAVAPEDLQAAETLTRSPRIQAMRGTGSVAEAAAMAALATLGAEARLIGPRQISTDRLATCALATGHTT